MNINNLINPSLLSNLRVLSKDIQTKILSYAYNQKKSAFVKPLYNPFLNIAIISDGRGYSVPKAIKIIEKTTGSKIRPINYHAPANVDLYALASEVTTALQTLEANKSSGFKISRVAAFIEQVKTEKLHAPISLSIIKKIQEIASNLDCIVLPGGEDIPPAWYEKDPQHVQEDFYRSLVEFTLINEAKNRGIPLMGICRGFQAVYVYNGKKLEADVPGHYGVVQTYRPFKNEQPGLLGHIFEDSVRGEVMHHQGVSVSEATKGDCDLEPLTAAKGLIKAAEDKHGGASPLILTQFHPEFYEPGDELTSYPDALSKNNSEFINILFEGAKVRNVKRLSIRPEALKEKRSQLRTC